MTANIEGPAELVVMLAGLLQSEPRRTLAQIAAETGLQERTMAELTTGNRPLSWEVTCAYVTACGGDKEEARALWVRVVRALERPSWQKHDAAGRVMGLWDRRDPVGRLPDPGQATTEAELNGQLNMLRTWANVPLRELETRTWPKVSDSTLSEVLNNRRRLNPQRAEILAAACGLPPWEASRWAEAAAQVTMVAPVLPLAPAPPPAARHPGPVDSSRRSSRPWPAFAGTLIAAALVSGGVILGILAVLPDRQADFVYLEYPQPVTVSPGSAADFSLSPLPSGRQDWYLDLRLRLGYTNPIANCVSTAQMSYRVDADGTPRRSGNSAEGQTDITVANIHLGSAGAVRITVVVHGPTAGCTLTLTPDGTVARPRR